MKTQLPQETLVLLSFVLSCLSLIILMLPLVIHFQGDFARVFILSAIWYGLSSLFLAVLLYLDSTHE